MAKLTVILLLVAVSTHSILSAPSSKIHHSLAASLAFSGNGKANILISFQGGTGNVLSRIDQTTFVTRTDRVFAVASVLRDHAEISQKNVLDYLNKAEELGKVTVLWISNQISVKGVNSVLVQALAEFPEVSELLLDEVIPIESHAVSQIESSASAPVQFVKEGRAEWAIENVRAHLVWEAEGGNTGEGVIVATIDTGVRGTHVALSGNFMEQYGWFDPYNSTPAPVDENGQGTHNMGVMVGSNGIGVAPGARWAACKGCDFATCEYGALITCGQFTLCPNPSCSVAPHIISGGFVTPGGNTFYDSIIAAWRSAGIIPLFGIGNIGPSCRSTHAPGENKDVFGVGAVNTTGGLMENSGRGPAYIDGGLKPDITAPGQLVNSSTSDSDTAYRLLTGTSANQITGGVIALLKSANMNLDYDTIKNLLCKGAETNLPVPGTNCGGLDDEVYPNNAYGCGKVDAFNTFNLLVQKMAGEKI